MRERETLAVRQAELVARCAVQRRDLAFTADDVGRSLWILDAAVAASRRVTARPVLLAAFVAVSIVVLRPGRVVRLLTWGLPAALSLRRVAALWLQRRHHGRVVLDN